MPELDSLDVQMPEALAASRNQHLGSQRETPKETAEDAV
jgi:hypothetical protein